MIRPGRALIAGALAATIVVLVLIAGGWALGAYLDPCALIAWVMFGKVNAWPWSAGLAIQIGIGALAALGYAAFFEWLAHRGGVAMGLLVAVPHVIAAGLIVGMLPMGATIEGALRAPGAFMALQGGAAVWLFCGAHLLYGVLVGFWYGPVMHPIARGATVRWHELPNTPP